VVRSSSGFLEIACREVSAQTLLKARKGDRVTVMSKGENT
jgi:hypothetical protein